MMGWSVEVRKEEGKRGGSTHALSSFFSNSLTLKVTRGRADARRGQRWRKAMSVPRWDQPPARRVRYWPNGVPLGDTRGGGRSPNAVA